MHDCRFAGNVAKMDHLACFAPAMLALGVHARAVTGSKAARYLALAEELTRTCWQMYAQMATGAAALPVHLEIVLTCKWHQNDWMDEVLCWSRSALGWAVCHLSLLLSDVLYCLLRLWASVLVGLTMRKT